MDREKRVRQAIEQVRGKYKVRDILRYLGEPDMAKARKAWKEQ